MVKYRDDYALFDEIFPSKPDVVEAENLDNFKYPSVFDEIFEYGKDKNEPSLDDSQSYTMFPSENFLHFDYPIIDIEDVD